MSVISNILPEISRGFNDVFENDLSIEDFQIENTRKGFKGDVTLVVFPLLKITKSSPEKTAESLGTWLMDHSAIVADYNVIKGFLNLVLSDEFWIQEFNKWVSDTDYGKNKTDSGKTFMVEYSSPNTNKPLHLGHLRNNFLGYSVAEILNANGHSVIKTQIINDRGIHICKSMLAWQKFGNGETPDSSGIKGDHLIGKYYVLFDKVYKEEIAHLIKDGISREDAEKTAPILKEAQQMLMKWEEKDPEIYDLWKKMNQWVYAGFDVTYQQMGVDFDKLYFESDTFILGKDIVSKGLEDGIFYAKEDGSVWVDLSEEKMDDKLLLRADGTSVYMTQDIGTAIERFKDFPEISGMIYTVGNEQNHHFNVLFSILKKIGYSWSDECYHLSYGMVELPEGKMKSREGTVVDADDLIESIVKEAKEMTKERGHLEGMNDKEKEHLYEVIGKGALKYYLLKVDPKKKMMFDPAESIDLNGNTGPFIQYGYARIQSILRKESPEILKTDTAVKINDHEMLLLKNLADFPKVITESAKYLSPSIIANYIYGLVKSYNSFYQAVPILGEEDKRIREFRILLTHKIGLVVKDGMLLLGIDVPKRM
jgi:arginyl-tRNA synthetase